MKIYYAPMEGITGYIYRNTYEQHFGKGRVDRYYTPFIMPKEKTFLSTKEVKDIAKSNNQGICVIPQILTNDAKGFLQTANALKEQGYESVNLNLGCPAATVVSKGRGAGFLGKTKELDEFLQQIMEETKVKVSIKTRLGVEDPEEVQILTEIFNQYEFQEWILHSRVREDFYKNTPHMDAFQYAYTHSKNHICYNGDIFTLQDYDEIREAYPQLEGVMIGRGLIANPGLVGEIYGDGQMKKEVLYHFLCDLQHRYAEVLSGDRDVLFRLKEIWAYMQTMFDAPNKDWKKMRKAQNLDAYQKAMDHLFETCELLTGAGFPGTK